MPVVKEVGLMFWVKVGHGSIPGDSFPKTEGEWRFRGSQERQRCTPHTCSTQEGVTAWMVDGCGICMETENLSAVARVSVTEPAIHGEDPGKAHLWAHPPYPTAWQQCTQTAEDPHWAGQCWWGWPHFLGTIPAQNSCRTFLCMPGNSTNVTEIEFLA